MEAEHIRDFYKEISNSKDGLEVPASSKGMSLGPRCTERAAQTAVILKGGDQALSHAGVSKKPKIEEIPAQDPPNFLEHYLEVSFSKPKVLFPGRLNKKIVEESYVHGVTKPTIPFVVVSPEWWREAMEKGGAEDLV